MESVNYFEDSQYDSVMDFDSHMNPFVKESICSNAEDECKIVEDTYADDEEMVCDDRVVEKKVHSTAGNGSTNLGENPRNNCSDAEDECKIVEDTYADDEEMVSKVPLPNYRADLDERHGSTQKEIRMSTETERRVGSLLDNSMKAALTIASRAVSSERATQSSSGVTTPKPVPALETDSAKEKVSAELKERQDRIRQGSSLKEMQAFREKLPTFKMRAEFLKAVAENQPFLKDEVIMVDDDSERVGVDKREIVVIDDDDNEKDKSQTSVEGRSYPRLQKGDGDFDLNKIPLSGLLKFSDPSSEKRFIEIMRKYQSKYY